MTHLPHAHAHHTPCVSRHGTLARPKSCCQLAPSAHPPLGSRERRGQRAGTGKLDLLLGSPPFQRRAEYGPAPGTVEPPTPPVARLEIRTTSPMQRNADADTVDRSFWTGASGYCTEVSNIDSTLASVADVCSSGSTGMAVGALIDAVACIMKTKSTLHLHKGGAGVSPR